MIWTKKKIPILSEGMIWTKKKIPDFYLLKTDPRKTRILITIAPEKRPRTRDTIPRDPQEARFVFPRDSNNNPWGPRESRKWQNNEGYDLDQKKKFLGNFFFGPEEVQFCLKKVAMSCYFD